MPTTGALRDHIPTQEQQDRIMTDVAALSGASRKNLLRRLHHLIVPIPEAHIQTLKHFAGKGSKGVASE